MNTRHSGGSLRRRLVAAVIIATAVVVAVAGTSAWLTGGRLRMRGAEEALRAYATAQGPRLLRQQWLSQREGPITGDAAETGAAGGTGMWRVLILNDGRVLGHDVPVTSGWVQALPAADGQVRHIDLPGTGPALVLVEPADRFAPMLRDTGDPPAIPADRPLARRWSERLAARTGPGAGALHAWIARSEPRLVAVHPLAAIEDEQRRQGWLLLGMWTLACALATTTALVATHRVLAPVRRLTSAIAMLRPGDHGQQVAADPLPDELVPVQERLNDLLARVDAALARESRTTANIAHELRTPLAGLRAKLELALARDRDPREVADLCRQGLATMTILQGLVDNLLWLTRLEAGKDRPRREAVEVADLVAAAWALHQPAAQARGLTLDRHLEPALGLVTDGAKLRVILANLFSNAVTYATPGSTISIAGEEGPDGLVHLRIANEGATIAPEDADKVFETFWRGDAARGGDGGHCGLGLPLVRRLALVLGGLVSAAVARGRFTISLDLPAGAASPPAD